MNSKKLPSRRDWFRLKWNSSEGSSTQKADNQETSKKVAKPVLQPVENPVNHGGMNLEDLPPMRQAELDSDQVSDLFSDVASCATDIQLMVRSSGKSKAPDLKAAKEAILSGSISRMQIRYRWQGKYWIDTLQPSDRGFQLIRIAHPGNTFST